MRQPPRPTTKMTYVLLACQAPLPHAEPVAVVAGPFVVARASLSVASPRGVDPGRPEGMPGRSLTPTLPGAALSRPGPPITSHAGGAATGRAGAFPGPSSRGRRGGWLVALPRGAEPCEVLGRPEPHGALHEREAGVGRGRLWCDDRRGSAPRRHCPRGHGARSLRRGCRRRHGFCRAGRPGRRRAAAWGTSNRECGSHRRRGLASSPQTPGRVVRECSQPSCESGAKGGRPGSSTPQRINVGGRTGRTGRTRLPPLRGKLRAGVQ
jgi:hypothetical protein